MSSMSHRNGNRTTLLLTLVAFFLACIPSVLHRSIWTDEVYTMLLLSGQMLISFPETVTTPEAVQNLLRHSASVAQTMHTLIEDDVHPPVYFLLAKAWASVFGQTLVSLRWLSVAIGLASIVVFNQFLQSLSPTLSRLATPVFAFSSGVLHYSTEVRHYSLSLLGLVTILYLMGALAARREKLETPLLAALVAATALTVLTNLLAIFPVAAAYLWFMALRSQWRSGLIGALCSLLLFSLWLPLLFRHRPDIAAGAHGFGALSRELYTFDYTAGASGWDGFSRQLYLLLQGTFGSLFIVSHAAYPNALHWLGRLFLASLVALGAASALQRSEPADTRSATWLFILLALAPMAGILLLYLLVDKQLYGLRYMMLASPGLAALCAAGILRLRRHSAKLGVVAWSTALALLLSVANWGYTQSYFQGKTIYRDLGEALQRKHTGNKLVIAGTGAMPGNTSALFHELSPHDAVLVLRPESNVDSVLAIAERYDDVWLIRVRELTRHVEDALAQSLQQTREKKAVIEQIEHYGKPSPAQP